MSDLKRKIKMTTKIKRETENNGIQKNGKRRRKDGGTEDVINWLMGGFVGIGGMEVGDKVFGMFKFGGRSHENSSSVFS
jgi:hypothetical protein